MLDEPTSGLDPIVRREFIQTVIGATTPPIRNTARFLSLPHPIGEFEGLIDEFTIIEQGPCMPGRGGTIFRNRQLSAAPAGLTCLCSTSGSPPACLADGNRDRLLKRPIALRLATWEEIFVAAQIWAAVKQ